jgi:Arc/MetJ-type ribon-helix-helix transcriptional regulator
MKSKKTFAVRMIQVVFRIPAELDSRIKAIAGKEFRSYSSVLRQATSEWLANRRGRSAPVVHTDEYLCAYSREHVYYEVERFFWAARLLGEGKTYIGATDGADAVLLNHGLIEVFVLHLRNLINFIFSDDHRGTDIVAAQFLPPGDWAKCRGTISTTLDRAKRRADKEMAHLTTDRITGAPPEKAWDFKGLADEIRPLIKLLSQKALSSRLAPNIAQAVDAVNKNQDRSITIFQTFGPSGPSSPASPTRGMTGP